MKVGFVQAYMQQGAEFPFTCDFQRFLSAEVTSATIASEEYQEKYGEDCTLRFYISAKHDLHDNEVRGPSVFRKTKDIEYTIFLPFSVIMRRNDPRRAALNFLFQGIYKVFEKLRIDSTNVRMREEEWTRFICSAPEMFESEADYLSSQARNASGVGAPLWRADINEVN